MKRFASYTVLLFVFLLVAFAVAIDEEFETDGDAAEESAEGVAVPVEDTVRDKRHFVLGLLSGAARHHGGYGGGYGGYGGYYPSYYGGYGGYGGYGHGHGHHHHGHGHYGWGR